LVEKWIRERMFWIRHHPGDVTVFSDEKLFYVDAAFNRRNDRFLSSGRLEEVPNEVKHVQRTKHPAKVMVLGLICSDGKVCPPIFIEAGIKINATVYQDLLKEHILPWLKQHYPRSNYVFQQDGAPGHTAKKTQRFLQDNFEEFWPSDFWPPSSPDLNPLDYYFWWRVERIACRKAHRTGELLRADIRTAWAAVSKDKVRTACQTSATVWRPWSPSMEVTLNKVLFNYIVMNISYYYSLIQESFPEQLCLNKHLATNM